MLKNDLPATQSTELVIIGAGPTGLTLACLCQQLGINIRVIDKKPSRSTTSKAIGLQYRVSEVLATMGIVDRFIERGSSPTPVNIYEGSHRLVRFQFDLEGRQNGRDAFTPRPILIPQSETEMLLSELLQGRGGKIEWNREFLSFDQDETGVVSKVRREDGSEEEIRSDWLVSCEGAHSVVRKQAGISFTGKTYPMAFVIADVEIEWSLNHDENHVWMHKDGSFAALPLPGGPNIWRLFFEVSVDSDLLSEGITVESIQRLMATRSDRGNAQVGNPIWLSEFKLNCRMVDQFRVGRVFIAGDAAHIHSPTGGQGITTGVQDAVNLAWKLGCVLRGAPESLLDTFQEERLPKAKEVLAETDRTTTIFFSTNPLIRLLRDNMILPILRMKSVQRRMFGKLSQLHVNYRESRLSQYEVKGRKLRPRKAGDRAPDILFQNLKSGERITLFNLLKDVRPVVLIGQEKNTSSSSFVESLLNALVKLDLRAYIIKTQDGEIPFSDEHCLVDIYGDFRQMYGLEGEFLCLVRPDGHLGLVQQPIRVATLKNYLQMICPVDLVEQKFSSLLNNRLAN